MPNQPDRHLRAQLPIPEVPKWGLTTYDAKDPDTKYPPIEPLRPPAGAPNVLIILLDDLGFGAPSAFGGPCYTPTGLTGTDYDAVLAVRCAFDQVPAGRYLVQVQASGGY